MIKSCLELELDIICNMCKGKYGFLETATCDIQYFKNELLISKDMKQEIKEWAEIVWGEEIVFYHFKKTIELYFPEYLSYLETIILLK
jgi:hypothetical protein